MATLNFKASSVEVTERTSTYEPLPAGDYEMMITKSASKPTKSGNGSYLELEMQVISGDFSGRRHWERLNLDNPNHQTVKIAQEQLARLCMALGVDEVEDSEQLHDLPFIAEVGIDKKDPTKNVIWNYRGETQAAPAKVAAKAETPAWPAVNKPAAKPWQK